MPRKITSRPVEGDVLLDDRAVCQRLGVSIATARRLRYRGELTSVRIGGAVRVTASSLDALIARGTVQR
ncbi:helix-turn-helix domain-containing protein [Cellulomonas sp. APG4]|uniref:helix-turn-helix domain-containing protein n=1 Tax=Cellulomonas sp. APG4 TaxID=1538656 RepID=UPI00137A01A5|nr:helix-turn-helix domain-containing protein [Cellulomonas sp. APG4]